MSLALALPTVAMLIGFPWFGLRANRPTAPADTLPVPWKSSSWLALENRLVLARMWPLLPDGSPTRLAFDPRQLRVTVQPDSGTISTLTAFGDVRLGQGTRLPLADYARQTSEEAFRRQWRARSRERVNVMGNQGTTSTSTGGLQFAFPSPLPRRVQSL